MRTSLIISAYNQAAQLGHVLASISRQTVFPDEIIVADDGSSDDTAAVLASFGSAHGSPPLRHVWQEHRGFGKATIQNAAIRISGGELLIFADGDMVLHPRFVEHHVRYRAARRICCGYRGVKLGERYTADLLAGRRRFDGGVLALYRAAWAGDLEHPIRGVVLHREWLRRLVIPVEPSEWPRPTYLSGGNFSVDREGIERVNGFDETIDRYGYEDFELGVRLQRIGYEFFNVSSRCITYHLWHQRSKRVDPGVKRAIRSGTATECRVGLRTLAHGTTMRDYDAP